MKKTFKIISKDYYSNCMIEAVKAKIKDWKHVKITYVSPFKNKVFCPHFLWSDGENDYDFGIEGLGARGIIDWTIHKGHIRKRGLGFNQRYKETCTRWRKHQKKKKKQQKK